MVVKHTIFAGENICAEPKISFFLTHQALFSKKMFGFVCRQKLTPQQSNLGTNPTGLMTTLMFSVEQVRTLLPLLLPPRKK